ncbi:hypothetical protein DITRI_Ditri17bG0015900 [Diplodiscus trichospermus]
MVSSALDVLVDCAQAIQNRNPKDVDSLLEQIWNLAADESHETRSEVVKYFAVALVRRAYGLHCDGNCFTLLPPPYYFQFSLELKSIIQDAIRNAVKGKKRVHLIDFHIPHLYGSGYLFFKPDNDSGDSLAFRVTVILPPSLEKGINLEEAKRYMASQAESKNSKVEWEDLKIVYSNSLGEIASEIEFRKTKDEAVVIFYKHKLHLLLAVAGAMEKELLQLRDINP